MDIERVSQQPTMPTRAYGASEQVSARRADRAANEAARGGDRIEISDRARELAKARQAVDAAPDVRADKVAQIKKRIEDGTDSVPAELLAQRLLGRGGDDF